MRRFSLKTAVVCLALIGGLFAEDALAASKAKHPPAKVATQRVSMLGGKLVFALPKDYVKSPMPEIDDKARAAGVTGSLYLNKPAHRVVIVTETPLPSGAKVSANDKKTLDTIIADALAQQKSSYQNFKKLGEKKLVRKGLGLRQLDISGDVDGGRVISTTITAASGTRTAMVNVISLERDAKDHGVLVKAVTGAK